MDCKEAKEAKNSRLSCYKDSKFSGFSKGCNITSKGNTKLPRDVEREKYDKYVDILQTKLEDEYDKRENCNTTTKDIEEPDITKPSKIKEEEGNESIASEALGDLLIVKRVDLHIRANTINHHTDKFEITKIAPKRLVIRRGQEFHFSVRFNRDFDVAKDFAFLDFRCGPDPKEVKHTKIELPIVETYDDKNKWYAKIDSTNGNIVTFTVQVPASAVIGLWTLKINAGLLSKPNRFTVHEVNQYIYMIFNPWCPEDQVYMESDPLKEEYVLSDRGKIWVGEHQRCVGRPWLFGQFDHVVLPVAMIIIEKTGLDIPARSSSISIVRALSAGVNTNDEGGLLTGCWKPPYKHGTDPTAWTGSIAILDKFIKSGCKSIKFGQCWVFSGVTTSLCRALGIPCRSVTNFSSAHDTDSSLCIERYFDKKGNPIEYRDSIWNFHVWNDVWMTRSDLPQGYDGWQAIDATPQERSGGIYQTGPASLKAIRCGEVGLMYETPFIFAEVNADVVYWHEGDNKKFVQGNVDSYRVGRSILTKLPNVYDPGYSNCDAENITDQYKPPDGSEEERLCFQRAFHCPKKPSRLLGSQSTDLKFNLKKTQATVIGQLFKISLEIFNTSAREHDVNVILSCSSCTYTGAIIDEIDRSQRTQKIPAGSGITINLKIEPKDYLDKVGESGAVKLIAIAKVLGTNQYFSEEDDFAFKKPEAIIEGPDQIAVGAEFVPQYRFTNCLSKLLTKCYITVDAPGICRPKSVRLSDVAPNENINFSEKLVAKEAGQFTIVILFHSKELSDVVASKLITVK